MLRYHKWIGWAKTTRKQPNAKKAIKKKIVKRIIKKKAPGDDPSVTATAAIATVKKEEIAVDQSKDEDSVQETEVTKPKKKVIRRVVKRKVVASGAKEIAAGERTEVEKDVKTEEEKEENLNAVSVANNCPVKMELDTQATHKEKGKEKEENKKEQDKEQEKMKEKEREKEKDHKEDKEKEKEKDKEREDKEKKCETRSSDPKHKSSTPKDVKEKSKHEEPPRHPGLILQVMRNKGSRVCLVIVFSHLAYFCILVPCPGRTSV